MAGVFCSHRNAEPYVAVLGGPLRLADEPPLKAVPIDDNHSFHRALTSLRSAVHAELPFLAKNHTHSSGNWRVMLAPGASTFEKTVWLLKSPSPAIRRGRIDNPMLDDSTASDGKKNGPSIVP